MHAYPYVSFLLRCYDYWLDTPVAEQLIYLVVDKRMAGFFRVVPLFDRRVGSQNGTMLGDVGHSCEGFESGYFPLKELPYS